MRQKTRLVVAAALAMIATRALPQSCQQSRTSMMVPIYYSAENLRSDTFDILRYQINLEIGAPGSPTISGNTVLKLLPKMPGRTFIRLDLLKLTVDSVKEAGSVLSYQYNDTVLKVNFAAPKNPGDTTWLTIHYHGPPQVDQSGWGGFYFDNAQAAGYAYNLGVGFAAKPHNYGRVWFPCFDNFVERSKYEFNITTDSTRRAYCNGALVSDQVAGTKRTRRWILNEEIPSYLACVAAARYTQVNWTASTLTGPKPVVLVSFPSDTSAMKTGFANLLSCINGFESYYGPYKWNRFGYTLVPFNSGAMEHATSISYPRNAIGSLGYEDLYTHELSHHWWGDLVTCETQEDMWINEGMATFSSYLFFEWQYGRNSYLSRVKASHDNLLHFLHLSEGGFRAVSGVPHALTYGDHVYKKGADIAHTLRGYMGDSLFFAGLKAVLAQRSFTSMNSAEFRDALNASVPFDVSPFFANWVFSGGWSHFSIDSVRYLNGTTAIVSIRQKLFGTGSLHSQVPLELTFFNAAWGTSVKRVVMSGSTSTFTLSLPFQPVYCALNFEDRISDATSHESRVIKSAGNVNLTIGKVFLQVKSAGQDSSLFRVVHHYVAPDPFKSNPSGSILSNQHYWHIEGILSPGFSAKARFNYDGNRVLSGSYSYMDTLLTQINGDSIALFYRTGPGGDWEWVRDAVKTKTGTRTGALEVDSVRAGEYTFGNLGDTLALNVPGGLPDVTASLYPNPATRSCRVKLSRLVTPLSVAVVSTEGKVVASRPVTTQAFDLDVSQFGQGNYLIRFSSGDRVLCGARLLVE